MAYNKNYDTFNDHAKTCAPDDFWGQVKRTVGGKAVSEEQIRMIVAVVVDKLSLRPEDALLDLCCGNGALSVLFKEHCARLKGVDFADSLIEVAQANFADPPRLEFFLQDVAEYVLLEGAPEVFTAAVCYGSFQYFDPDVARTMLIELRKRFSNVTRLLLGNMPDKSRLQSFYTEQTYIPGIESDCTSPLGMWRSMDEVAEMAVSAGWDAMFSVMPPSYHASHYRFDALLTPRMP